MQTDGLATLALWGLFGLICALIGGGYLLLQIGWRLITGEWL